MAKQKPEPQTEDKITDPSPGTLESRLKTDYKDDLDRHDDAINALGWEGNEAMVMSQVYDDVSRATSNGITDGSTTTIYLERSARVVGQVASGYIEAAGKQDTGKAMFMDILLQKWVLPNANSQMPFLEKIRNWQFGSSVYNNMPMHYDWVVSPSGYIGPDCWLWNPRNAIPQAGYTNVDEMDHYTLIAEVGPQYMEDLLDEDDDEGWDKDEIRQYLDVFKNNKKELDDKRSSFIRRERTNGAENKIFLATRYESGDKGRWITFLPDYGFTILRNIPNPHKNGRIPIITKPCIPWFDSYYGIGDFQRSKPIQFAKDGLTNFYFMGIKRNLYPRTIINGNGVQKHTISQDPGSVIVETIPNSVRTEQTSTAGLSTYEAASTQMQGALLNLAGTTDTAANKESTFDPGFGKTPQALQMLQARESTRDNQDRFYLESRLEVLIDRMLGLIPVMATEPMKVTLFSDELQEIVESGYDDVLEIIKEGKTTKKPTKDVFLNVNESEETAELVINPKALKGVEYRFNIKRGSTKKVEDAELAGDIENMLAVVSKFANELGRIAETEQKEFNFEYWLGEWAKLKGLKNDKIFKPVELPPQPEIPQEMPPEMPPQGAMPPEMPPAPQGNPLMPMSVGGYEFTDPELAARANEILNAGGQQ